MSRALVVQYGCDAVACGVTVWVPVKGDDPDNLPGEMPGDWAGTARVQFCPKHAHQVHAHVSSPPASSTAVDRCLLEDHIAGRCQHAGRCVTCGAQASYDPHGGRYVHDDPAVSMAVDHAARVILPRTIPPASTTDGDAS